MQFVCKVHHLSHISHMVCQFVMKSGTFLQKVHHPILIGVSCLKNMHHDSNFSHPSDLCLKIITHPCLCAKYAKTPVVCTLRGKLPVVHNIII